MRFSIRVDLFHQFLRIALGSCRDLFLDLLLRVGVGLDVSMLSKRRKYPGCQAAFESIK